MKIKFLSIALGAACALALAACGDGEDNFGDVSIKVNLINVTKPGLQLQLNGATAEEVVPGNSFVFQKSQVPANNRYKVTIAPPVGGVAQIPPNAEKCEVINPEGSVGIYPPEDLFVSCTLFTYDLGGTVTGPHTEDFVVANGAATVTVKPGDTTFALPKVPESVPYSVAILQQPTSSTCTVVTEAGAGAPVGSMPKGPLTNLKINCVAK